MENNINNKNNYNFMGKLVSIILLLSLTLFNVNAVTQNELLRWEFETCTGSIVFDTSGNNNNGVLQNGAKFDSNPFKNGICSIVLDGSNDFVSSLTSQNTPDKLSFSVWLNSADTNNWYALEISDTYENYQLEYDNINNILEFGYFNHLEQYTHYNLETYDIPLNTWINYIISIDTNTDTISYWRDGINIIDNLTLTGGINKYSSIKTLELGKNRNNNEYFKGNIDSFRLFDFILNQTQVDTLYNSNFINLINDEINNDIIYNNSINTNIIKSYYPNQNNSDIMFLDSIKVDLFELSSCDLYLDNSLIKQYSNMLAFNFILDDIDLGEHSYFTYCYNIIDGIKNYEISNVTNFNLSKPSKTIDFYIYNQDGTLLTNYDDLYLTTPCFKSTELSKYNVPDREAYIQPLVYGMASFNLSYDANYEFCMLKGKVNSKYNTYSLNYDLPQVEKQTNLGKLFVTNSTYTYSLKVDETDLYKVSDPEFWGKTWSALFELIIGTLLGGLLIFIGLIAKNDKLMMVGGLVIAIGMGVGITSFLGVLI